MLQLEVHKYHKEKLLGTKWIDIPASSNDIVNAFDNSINASHYKLVNLNIPINNSMFVDAYSTEFESIHNVNNFALLLYEKLGEDVVSNLVNVFDHHNISVPEIIDIAHNLDRHEDVENIVTMDTMFDIMERYIADRNINNFNQIYKMMLRLDDDSVYEIYADYCDDIINTVEQAFFKQKHLNDNSQLISIDNVEKIIYLSRILTHAMNDQIE